MPAIRLTHPVRFHGEKSRWIVPSQSRKDVPNFVDMDEEEGEGQCSCEDWKFRHVKLGPRYSCRHIRMVMYEIAMLEEWANYEWKVYSEMCNSRGEP